MRLFRSISVKLIIWLAAENYENLTVVAPPGKVPELGLLQTVFQLSHLQKKSNMRPSEYR